MDPAGRPDPDSVATRPDTVGVGWPVAPGFAEPPTVRWWAVAVVATASAWAPISLFVGALGAMSVFGWGPAADRTSSGGLVNGFAVDAAVSAAFVVVAFVTVSVGLGAMLRAATDWSTRRIALTALVLTTWAPVAVAALLAAT